MPNCKVIRFNVGGTHYEVSQSLLDIYPSSFLTKLCSENWHEENNTNNEKEEDVNNNNNNNNNKAIFIDRNGERFQYILDYMRDTRVELPMSIPRGQFICDMEYYGLEYDDSNIMLSVASPSDLFHSLGRYRDYFQEKLADVDQRLFAVAAEKLACEVAKEYFSQLIHQEEEKPGTTDNHNYYPNNNKHRNIKRGINFFCPAEVKVKRPPGYGGRFQVGDIQSHLNAVGLKADWLSYGNYYHNGDDDEVSVKLRLM